MKTPMIMLACSEWATIIGLHNCDSPSWQEKINGPWVYTMSCPRLCEFSTCLGVSDPLFAPCCLLLSLTLVISPCIRASPPLRPSSFSRYPPQAPPWLVLFMTSSCGGLFPQNHLFFINWHFSCHVMSCLFSSILLYYVCVVPWVCVAAFLLCVSHVYLPPNRTMTTRRRCTVLLSMAIPRWCGCCWRSWRTPPWGITSLRPHWTWRHCTDAWR